MFDIGFSELMVIAVVALIVIGPERLPKVARTLGHLFGRMQRYVNDVKADISREMELEELRKLQASVQDAAQSMQQAVTKEITEAESHLQQIAETVPSSPESEKQKLEQLSAATASQQLELGLDSSPQAPARKRA